MILFSGRIQRKRLENSLWQIDSYELIQIDAAQVIVLTIIMIKYEHKFAKNLTWMLLLYSLKVNRLCGNYLFYAHF